MQFDQKETIDLAKKYLDKNKYYEMDDYSKILFLRIEVISLSYTNEVICVIRHNYFKDLLSNLLDGYPEYAI